MRQMSLPEEVVHQIELRRLSGESLGKIGVPLSVYGRTLRIEVSLLLQIDRDRLVLVGDTEKIADEDMLCERIGRSPPVITVVVHHSAAEDAQLIALAATP